MTGRRIHSVRCDNRDTVAAIIISYNPDPIVFAQLMARIAIQVDHLIVVDNASLWSLHAMVTEQVAIHGALLFSNTENLGLAAGQGMAIKAALAINVTFTLLLDQDSLPAPDMVSRLVYTYNCLLQQGLRIAGVGPVTISKSHKQSVPFVRFRPYAVVKNYCHDTEKPVQTDFLISSGLLTPTWAYASVGFPDDTFFIDNIDLEWCFRARHRGFQLYGICDAVLYHQIGKQTRFLLRNPKWPIHIHDPIRQYYQTRNRIRLYSCPYAPWAWRLQDFPRLLFKLLYFGLLIPPRREHLRMMLLAIWDALHLVGGPFRHDH